MQDNALLNPDSEPHAHTAQTQRSSPLKPLVGPEKSLQVVTSVRTSGPGVLGPRRQSPRIAARSAGAQRHRGCGGLGFFFPEASAQTEKM
ncbi:hypothetical protein EYF80_032233 [Liparis tanakae]|uniref:Uncharacterized protein n=1 Tax=Liparis tanakae TaxID=230148 RepID=A0A4Z2GVN1_9TELE|nr:hypothetical protein EYF80_032233 [Liparis tanakae]